MQGKSCSRCVCQAGSGLRLLQQLLPQDRQQCAEGSGYHPPYMLPAQHELCRQAWQRPSEQQLLSFLLWPATELICHLSCLVLQLQQFSNKQQQLELQYRPVVQQLPTLLEQLRPEELSQAAEFAALEGMREPLLQVSGSKSAALSSTAAQSTDPFGIRIAFSPGHPLSLLTWGQYLAIVTRMSKTVEQQLQQLDWQAVAAFNSQRRQLVRIAGTVCADVLSQNEPGFCGLQCVVVTA